MANAVDPVRRGLLRGRLRPGPAPRHPPWATAAAVAERCTRCTACADACPESIIAAGDGGFPEVNFRRGECTFCAACADACPAGLFAQHSDPPWDFVATVGPGCLAGHGVVCQSCRDACEPRAIAFPRSARPGRPTVDTAACTGCGACVAPCPVDAITVGPPLPTPAVKTPTTEFQGDPPCPTPPFPKRVNGTSPA